MSALSNNIANDFDSKISLELQKILLESTTNTDEVQYDLIEFLDSGKEISDADFKKIMHELANINSKFDRFYITKHKLTHDQQETLLAVLSKMKGMEHLVLNGFNLTKTMIQQLSTSLSLKELRIYNISQCSPTNELQFSVLAQTPYLETLVLRYQSFEVSTICGNRNFAEQETSNINHHKSLITPHDILFLINTDNRLLELECPDAGFKQEDVTTLEKALENNKSLEYICLANTLKINMHNISQYVVRNKQLRFPSDKIRTVENEKGQNVMFWSSTVMRKIQALLRDSSGEDLKQKLDSLGFDPNGYCYTGDENPILNSWIANELHIEATRIIEEYSDKLDTNHRDNDQKTALIIAAKAYSANNELLALLKTKIKDINAQDAMGCTALHYLCAYGKSEFVKALLERGADLKVKDKQGRTPLDYANALSEADLRAILSSMSLQPDRDANAVRDNLLAHLGISIIGFPPETVGFLISNIKNLELLKSFIQSDEFLKLNSDSVDRKKLYELCAATRQSFSGKSIIETCMEQRKHLEENLKSSGFLSPKKLEMQFTQLHQEFEKLDDKKAMFEDAVLNKVETILYTLRQLTSPSIDTNNNISDIPKVPVVDKIKL